MLVTRPAASSNMLSSLGEPVMMLAVATLMWMRVGCDSTFCGMCCEFTMNCIEGGDDCGVIMNAPCCRGGYCDL